MKRELVKIGVALTLLVGFLVLIWWHRSGLEEKALQEEEDRQVLSFELDTLSGVTLSNKEGEVQFVRRKRDQEGLFDDSLGAFSADFTSPSEWLIVDPVVSVADSGSVTTFLENLRTLTWSKLISEDGGKLASYSLDPEKVKITLYQKGKKGPALVLRIGDINTAATGFFLQSSAKPRVVLADMKLDYLKTRTLTSWRKKEVVDFSDSDLVKKITVVTANGKKKNRVTVERTSGKNWKMTAPIQARADSEAVERFFNELRSIRAEAFSAESANKNAKQFGLDRPDVRVTLYFGEKEQARELIIGKEGVGDSEKTVPLRRTDLAQVFHVSRYMKANLSKDFQAWVAKNPFDLKKDRLTRVEIKHLGQELDLFKKDDLWEAAKPAGLDLDQKRVATLLSQIVGLKGKEYLGKKRAPEKKEGALYIALTEGERKRELWLYREGENEPEGRALPSGVSYRFAKGDYDLLPAQAFSLEKKPTPTPVSEE